MAALHSSSRIDQCETVLHIAVAGSDIAKSDARSDHADLYAYVFTDSTSERLF